MATNISAALESIERCMHKANNAFMIACYNRGHDGYADEDAAAEYYVERAFVEFLILAEHLELAETYRTVSLMLAEASKDFGKNKMGHEEPFLVWPEKLRMYVDGVSSLHGLGDTAVTEIRDLKAIVERSLYVICNTKLFPNLPSREADVHDRIEAILKCYFSDLKRKPALTKPIKNFEPDTGIPSTKTLIEYKFVTNEAEAKRVVDEILADASGYRSPQWKNLLFVIYETHRIMPEEDWRSLLRDCELGSNYDAVVLSGDSKLGV